MKKHQELLARERDQAKQAKTTTTIHLGDLAPGESVSIPVRFKSCKRGEAE